jgi:general secretion pathway protein G
MKKRLGFTLIELLVAIAIMAVIMAIAVPNFLGARERARDTKLKSEMQQLKSALLMYYNDHQTYPGKTSAALFSGCGISGVNDCPNTISGCTSFEFSAGGAGCDTVYMKKLPTATLTGMTYAQLADGEGFSLCANLENTADQDGATSRTKCTSTIVGTTNVYCVCSE